MHKIRNAVVALAVFIALPIVQANAADQPSGIGFGSAATHQTAPRIYQNGGTTTKPSVLTQAYPFSCEKGSCWCKNSTDCGEMGRLGVCKPGTFKDSKTGGGTCTQKQV